MGCWVDPIRADALIPRGQTSVWEGLPGSDGLIAVKFVVLDTWTHWIVYSEIPVHGFTGVELLAG